MSRDWAELERLAAEEAPPLRQRIDPEACGCTDCQAGYSVNVYSATADELEAAIRGDITNASGWPLKALLGRLEFLEDRP